MELKRCTKCVLTETHETITFDENGVCNSCNQIKVKREQIDWDERKKQFGELLEQYRGKYDYDCIVPFSGGKDSTYTLLKLVKDYKLKPLVVSFDHGFYRPTVEENKLRTFRKLGVDVIKFTPNWKVVQKLMKEALLRKGDFCWHCHTGIFAYPMQVAIKYNVPLIIWGEPSSEYTSYYSYEDGIEEVDEERFNRYINLGITAEDMVGMLDGTVTESDLLPFTYPKLRDLKRLKYRSICLGSYIPWDVKKQSERIVNELDWQGEQVEGVPPEYPYEKIECMFQGVRDYLKYIKRGYARTSHLTTIDIRNDRLERDKAMALVKQYEGKKPASLEVFLEYVGMTEDEFNEMALKNIVYPNECDPTSLEKGKENWDQEIWFRDDEILPLKSVVNELKALRKENKVLKEKLKDLE